MKSFTKKSLSLLALSLTGAVACGTFVGCGSDDDDTTGTTDAGKDGTTGTTDSGKTDGAPSGDSGPTDGGTSDADTGTTPPVDAGPAYVRRGSVSFSQTKSIGTYGTTASASFSDTIGVTAVPGYVTTQLDSACSLTVYTPQPAPDAGDAGDAGDADAGTPPSLPEAATITITDGTTAFPAAVTLSPTAGTGVYTPASTTAGAVAYFIGGDAIGFSAAGDTNSVGAFSTTVTAPADIGVTAPATLADTVTSPIARGSDLAVTWTNGQLNTFVNVTFSTSNKTTFASKTLTCKFAAGGGTGTVPTADLSQLDEVTTGGNFTGALEITPFNSATGWGAVDGVDAGENPDASSQDYLVTTTVSGTLNYASYTNSN